MPERAINTKSATGWLLVLIPAALTMSALFVAWPVILGVTLLIAGGNIWQNHEWSKLTRSIDPVFQQLIVQNRGEITPLDLALKANVSGAVSNRYLVAKADEFGTGRRQHPDRGQVYYFVSISTLGQIFDDSERELPSIMPATTPVVAFQSTPTPAKSANEVSLPAEFSPSVATSSGSHLSIPAPEVSLAAEVTPIVTTVARSNPPTPSEATPQVEIPVANAVVHPSSNLSALFDGKSAPAQIADSPPTTAPLAYTVTIVQSELAKRLDVHPSTVYKRRSEPNFTDWTRNRDPDGIGWGYAEAGKEYYRVDT
jgi:hypothetical protein